MGDFLKKLRSNEPVRLYAYPALVVLLGILVVKGTLDQETSDFVTAAVALVLGIGGVEKARAGAFSPSTVAQEVAITKAEVTTQVNNVLVDKMQTANPAMTNILEQVQNVVQEIGGRHRRPE